MVENNRVDILGSLDGVFIDFPNSLDGATLDIPNSLDKNGIIVPPGGIFEGFNDGVDIGSVEFNDGVDFGTIDECVIAGKFAYIVNKIVSTVNVATVNIQEADDLKFIKNMFIATADQGQLRTAELTGDHLYIVNNASGTNGRLYSLRLSGIDSQSARFGAVRTGFLDVKDELTGRTGEFSESLIVGGRGIYSQGLLGGGNSSDIKRSVKNIVIAGASSTVVLDMTDDITTYIIDAFGITGDWNIDVENIKVGHKIQVQVSSLPAGNIDLVFADAKFAVDGGDTDTLGDSGDLAVLEAVLDTGAANTVILTVTEV